MTHGFANLVYDHQGGPRGGDEDLQREHADGDGLAATSAPAASACAPCSRPSRGRSARQGYPLLLQTGETGERRHAARRPPAPARPPHGARRPPTACRWEPTTRVFVYAGLPGEPALGPATFMHRFSGMDNPEAPLSHHWLDSTHVTFGVATLGWIHDNVKLEGSVFTGREPDQNRTNIESPKMDSWSVRASWQPAPDWSLQVSHGHLHSPEQLEPEVDDRRTTASAMYNRPLADGQLADHLRLGAQRPAIPAPAPTPSSSNRPRPAGARPSSAGSSGRRTTSSSASRRGVRRLHRRQAVARLHL